MIYLIITTSINNKVGIKNEEERKKDYITTITSTLSFVTPNIKPIIVENNGKRKTFLDDFNIDIFYTDNNFKNYYHKGFNELDDIKDVISFYNIQDNDIIIKLTGRYSPMNNLFFKFVEENQNKYDAFIKFFNVNTLKYENFDLVLGMYAIKCKYLKNFNYQNINLSPEVEFAKYVKSIKNILIFMIDFLHLYCKFADNNSTLIV